MLLRTRSISILFVYINSRHDAQLINSFSLNKNDSKKSVWFVLGFFIVFKYEQNHWAKVTKIQLKILSNEEKKTFTYAFCKTNKSRHLWTDAVFGEEIGVFSHIFPLKNPIFQYIWLHVCQIRGNHIYRVTWPICRPEPLTFIFIMLRQFNMRSAPMIHIQSKSVVWCSERSRKRNHHTVKSYDQKHRIGGWKREHSRIGVSMHSMTRHQFKCKSTKIMHLHERMNAIAFKSQTYKIQTPKCSRHHCKSQTHCRRQIHTKIARFSISFNWVGYD